MASQVNIEVYLDFCCPWCLIGVARLNNVIAELGKTQQPSVVYLPRILDPSMTDEGVDIQKLIRDRYHIDPVDAWVRPHAEAASSGVTLDLAVVRYAYSTVSAQTLVRYALNKNNQQAFVWAILKAYFLEGQNIAEQSVLVEIAKNFGFMSGEVEKILTDSGKRKLTLAVSQYAAEKGVNSVPAYIFSNGEKLSGCQPEKRLKRAILQNAEGV